MTGYEIDNEPMEQENISKKVGQRRLHLRTAAEQAAILLERRQRMA